MSCQQKYYIKNMANKNSNFYLVPLLFTLLTSPVFIVAGSCFNYLGPFRRLQLFLDSFRLFYVVSEHFSSFVTLICSLQGLQSFLGSTVFFFWYICHIFFSIISFNLFKTNFFHTKHTNDFILSLLLIK